MSHRKPDRATVLAELEKFRHEAKSTGARVSVVAMAKRVGLANTTFRRQFADITEQIRTEEPAAPTASTDPTCATANTAARVRQRNQDLQENLELAIAAIQRLTLENHKLRQDLEAARAVTAIGSARRTRTSVGL